MEPDHLGKYEIRGILGRGATGIVYEAYDPVIARRVAIKTVVLPDRDDTETKDDLERFRREAQAAGRLNHPNIVGVYDYGETEELAYIVMEYVEGITLKPALDKGERFTVPEVVLIMTALLEGLAYSHANGVIHRDIKPANVMLTRDHKIKLADFGVARIESSNLTQAGTMIGTPTYMSPEQFTGHPADARTDIYSAGVLLYQMLTGEKPFEGGITAIMHKVLSVEPPAPSALSPAVPPALDDVVLKAMAKSPETRFQTASAFAAALNEAALPPPSDAGLSVNAAPALLAPLSIPLSGPPSLPPSLPPLGPASPEALGESDPEMARPEAASAAPSSARRGRSGILLGGAIIIAAAILLAFAINSLLRWQSVTSPMVMRQAGGASSAAKPLVFSLNRIKTRLAAAAAPVSCTLLHADVTAQAARVAGLAGHGRIPALQAALRVLPVPVHLAVERFGGPFCPALNTVRPYAAMFAGEKDRLGLGLVNGKTILVDGQLIMPQLHMPLYPTYLEVDYLSHDGSVFHLYPTPSDPQAVQPAGGMLVLGNPKSAASGLTDSWVAGPPYGRDMILAVATSKPLFSADRLQAEPDAVYLAALRDALRRVRMAGGKISVAAILLKAVAAADAPKMDFGMPQTATGSPLRPPPQTVPAAPAK
jgi:serine/threonine protein kinase